MKNSKWGIRIAIVLGVFVITEFWGAVKLVKSQPQNKLVAIEETDAPHILGNNIIAENNSKEDFGYIYTKGKSLFLNGKEYIIQGVCASNAVAASPGIYDSDMMKEEDYKEIADIGMNTVRFMMNYDLLEDDNKPYVYKDTGWEWIDMNLRWAEKYGIHVILDCHLSQGGIPAIGGNHDIWTVGGEKQERLVAMWKAIAQRYRNNTTVLGYGLLNEPLIDTNREEDWQALANRLKDTVRSVDKNHIIIVQRALLEKDRSYVYPVLDDNNWMLEIHKYPTTDMKMIKDFFHLPREYFYYGSDTIIARRIGAIEKNVLSFSVLNNQKKISKEWKEYTYKFIAPPGSSHAYILFEVLNIDEAQGIQISNVSVMRNDGKEVYDLQYNIKDEYTFYSLKETAKIEYLSSKNIIKVQGGTDYVAFADNSIFRFFKLEENQEYTLKFQLRAETELNTYACVKARIKCYDAEKIYMLDKGFLDYLLRSGELSERYGVPVYYGEIGIERIAYEEKRSIDVLSNDMINWLVENKSHFTWFNWHEPNYGMYTSPGLEPKKNPNTVLLEQMERALKRK